MSLKLLYAAFDIVPSPKGAAVHIEQFANILSGYYQDFSLLTVAEAGLDIPACGYLERELRAGFSQILIPAPGKNLLDRVLNFRRFLENWCSDKHFDLAHFRSPFEGLPLARLKSERFGRLIFEVNGLPSVELKYRYPQIADDIVLLEKLLAQEKVCFEAADLLITPSPVTAVYLQDRGVEKSRIRVIPNSIDLDLFSYFEAQESLAEKDIQLIYFGTLSAWQGVEQAIAATALLSKTRSCRLKILGAAKAQQLQALVNYARKLAVLDFVEFLPPCSQKDLLKHIHASDFVLAPLSANDRNLSQGCCPFKVLEGMASGTPVLASDLPVVQALQGEEECIKLTKPGSAGAIHDALQELIAFPEKRLALSRQARRRVEQNYNLKQSALLLIDAYEFVVKSLSSSAFN
ncbi:MAG: glycosyltransferase family 4 protein [Candidatus Obscuribacterales bacterium]|nr:glycosyltransferase family 4 protein [Candidatus Obscuribacterales bacterium]